MVVPLNILNTYCTCSSTSIPLPSLSFPSVRSFPSPPLPSPPIPSPPLPSPPLPLSSLPWLCHLRESPTVEHTVIQLQQGSIYHTDIPTTSLRLFNVRLCKLSKLITGHLFWGLFNVRLELSKLITGHSLFVFYFQEHIDYLAFDEDLGPLIMSVRAEKHNDDTDHLKVILR